MSLCSLCSNQSVCEVSLPEFVKAHAIFACEKYATNLKLPVGFGKLRKAINKYGSVENCKIECEECFLQHSGICDDILGLTESIDGLLGKRCAENAQG